MGDSDSEALFEHVVRRLDQVELSYLYIVEPRVVGSQDVEGMEHQIATNRLRKLFRAPIISAGGYDVPKAEAVIAAGDAELVAFGRSSSQTRTSLSVCAPERRSTGTIVTPSTVERRRVISTTHCCRRKPPSDAAFGPPWRPVYTRLDDATHSRLDGNENQKNCWGHGKENEKEQQTFTVGVLCASAVHEPGGSLQLPAGLPSAAKGTDELYLFRRSRLFEGLGPECAYRQRPIHDQAERHREGRRRRGTLTNVRTFGPGRHQPR
ncbi:hypothetical protein ELH97_15015 [Rhizobium leguminosarum]|nr:hypothetical protein ELH97_15015 [Rhizobium leguminosarum]